jgi:perosamine synthetase
VTEIPLSAPDITQVEIEAVTAVLRTNRLSLGPELEAFERAMASYHGIAEAVAVSSGTAGLHLSLVALGIGKGCEVIVPSFAFVAVANAVAYVGATPVFVDIDPVTLNLDPILVEQAITPRTRAILVVHTFGVPAEMDRFVQIARAHGLALIEDACEALGAEFDSQKAGTFGDVGVFGFYPNKQITTGEGGCILTRDPQLAERLRSLRNHGRPAQGQLDAPAGENPHWFDHMEVGYNYRLSELACALGRTQLQRIEEILSMRRAAAERYQKFLADVPELELAPIGLPRRSISWFVFVVRLTRPEIGPNASAFRDRLQELLASRRIATARYFAPIHQQPAWSRHPNAVGLSLPRTESVASRTLALPFFNRITSNQQERVAAGLVAALRDAHS